MTTIRIEESAETPAAFASPDAWPLAMEGSLRVLDSTIFTFPCGIPGFANARHFTLEGVRGGGDLIHCLHSIDHDGPTFRLWAIPALDRYYRAADFKEAIGRAPHTRELAFLVTNIRVYEGRWMLTGNARAPILLDTTSCTGVQVILANTSHSMRLPLAEGRTGR